MRLFISHASEDKADFVRPLAEALRQTYEVWYDEYELTLGDSLFTRINEGLASCHFGVVVLSKDFFAKKWPQAELDGLSALETESRKVILPVWKGIDVEDVKKFSPILAGRMAVSATAGIPAVVEAIRVAVATSERKRQVTIFGSATQNLLGLDETLTEARESAKLLESPEGVQLLSVAAAKLFDIVESNLLGVSGTANIINFICKRPRADAFVADTIYRLSLAIMYSCLYTNSAHNARLKILIYRRKDIFEGEDDSTLFQKELVPAFRLDKTVVWKLAEDGKSLSADEVGSLAIDALYSELKKLSGGAG